MAEQEDIKIRVEGMGLRATLTLSSGALPESVDADVLAGMARTEGVQITSKVIDRIREIHAQLAEHPTREPITFAEATAPVHGVDGKIEWREKFDPAAKIGDAKAAGSTDAAVDHYSVSTYLRVEADEVLGVLHAPTAGEDGLSVTGSCLAARPGMACRTTIDGATVRTEDDGRLVGISAGVLKYDGCALSVVDILEIPGNVDFSTGHIDFDGSVEIREGVRDRFNVRATKDVRVGGLIEAATIICGGQFACQRGVACRDRAQLLIGGDASAGFLNNVRGRICGDLAVKRELINCDLAIGGYLRADSAGIIGGTIILTRGLTVAEIGSEAHPVTVLRLGEMPMLSQRVRQLAEEIAERDIAYQRLLDEQKQLQTRRNANASERERITKIMYDMNEARQHRDKARQERRRLVALVRDLSGVSIRITKMLWGNTYFMIDGRSYRIRDDVKGPVTITWNKRRQLMFQIADGPMRRLTEIAHPMIGDRAA